MMHVFYILELLMNWLVRFGQHLPRIKILLHLFLVMTEMVFLCPRGGLPFCVPSSIVSRHKAA